MIDYNRRVGGVVIFQKQKHTFLSASAAISFIQRATGRLAVTVTSNVLYYLLEVNQILQAQSFSFLSLYSRCIQSSLASLALQL